MSARSQRVLAPVLVGLMLAAIQLPGQNIIGTGGLWDISTDGLGRSSSITANIISPSVPATEGIKYKVDRVEVRSGAPNFLIAVPASGVTQDDLYITANPQVVRTFRPSATIDAVVVVRTVDQTPPSEGRVRINLTVRASPPPRIHAVGNSASLEPILSPGSMVSIFGENLGPLELGKGYGPDGAYPTSVGDLTVTIGGAHVPITYVSPSQIDVVAPFELTGRNSAAVVVSRLGETTPEFLVPVAETSPAIFTGSRLTAGQSGILNYPGPVPNTRLTPAAPGSVVAFFATGAGIWGDLDPLSLRNRLGRATQWVRIHPLRPPFCLSGYVCVRPVSVTIGGLPAPLWYSGIAPFQPAGVLQVNVQVPEGLAPGTHPVVLKIGDADNARQGVTIEVR